MSLEAFQRAFAEMVASPRRCIELRSAEAWLDGFDLDDRERRRLVAMARHPGMSHNCTLYRSNRLTAELEAFWASEPDSELQFKREAQRFASFLLKRLRDGALTDPSVADELEAELQTLEQRFAPAVHP
jgi:hypothetical protein